jgi:hypothetical protein
MSAFAIWKPKAATDHRPTLVAGSPLDRLPDEVAAFVAAVGERSHVP